MKKKVLYIDDEKINLELFEINFRREYEVITSDNPENAMDIISAEEIDVIISDYKMPEMNGLELIEIIKQNKPQSVCIILSGYMERDVSTDSSNVYKHIMKPYKKAQLKEVIEEAFDYLAV